MQSTKTGDSLKKSFLVFALTRHEVLGHLIESFAVSVTRKGQFEYNFKKVTKNTYWDYFDDLSEFEISLIEKLDKYSDENLQKRFNTKKLRTSLFYESLEQDFLANHIRPLIDKVIYDAISFMAENNLNLFYKGDTTERIRENQIMLTTDLARTCFNFEKREHNTHYRLQVTYGSEELNLYNRGAMNITVKPCVLLLEKKIYRFEPQWDGKKLVPFFGKEFLEIPVSSEKQFFKKFVEKSIRQYPFVAKGFDVRVMDDIPVPNLQLENHWQGNIALGLYFRYSDAVTFLPGDTAPAFTRFIDDGDHFHFEKIVRNREFENRIIDFLLDKGLSKLDSTFFTNPEIKKGLNGKQPEDYLNQAHLFIDWMNQNLDEINKHGIQLGKEYSGNEFFTGSMDINLDVAEKTDWFDLKGKVRFGEFEIPFMNLRSCILAGNREYILPDGTIALIPEEWMSKYHDLMKFAQKRGERLELKKYHYTLLEKIHVSGIKIPLAVQGFFHGKKYDPPAQINAQLRPYQQNGFNWMMYLMESGMGGCLADDMGLGKTIQALALLTSVHLSETDNYITEGENAKTGLPVTGIQLDMFAAKHIDPAQKAWHNCSLIIMPLSLIHNWFHEINRFAPGLKVLIHTGSSRKTSVEAFKGYDLALTTYGTVRNDIDFLTRYRFKYIILDESQIIKNASSKVFSAIKRLESEHRMVLTGTPVENSLTDLWSQFSFINPGMLGSLKFFKEEFVIPIEKRQDKKKVEKLQNLIQPFILRRTKDQVAKELPPLTEKIHYCEMTPEQEQYYERKKSEIRNAIIHNLETIGTDKTRFLILSGLTRLRLIANHPAIIDRDYSYGSGKYIEIVRNIEKLLSENHKVLIFSQFVKHLNLFASFFEEQRLPYSHLTGSVAEKDRKNVIKKFQEDESRKLFLISLRAGGVGLNLTGADYVFMLDPWWNPAVENQAINRAHRIGQDKNVFVYKFITRNTVEEKIVNLQQRKSDLAGMFINQNNPLKSLDIRELTDVML
jgi:superfamily II DNA or RNA helicase